MSKCTDVLKMMDTFNQEDVPKYIKSYMFIKGYAIAKNLNQTIIALTIARRMHDGQYRKGGDPYLCHPLKVCSTLINYGIDDDATLSAALLHDVLEDCQEKLPLSGKELVSEYGVSQEVFDIISLLTKESGLSERELSIYFNNIKKNPKALLIKLSDRLHNSCTLWTFSYEKLRKYLNETSLFLIPMASYGKNYYPQYTNAFSILKTSIWALNTSIEVMLNIADERIAEMKAELDNANSEIERLKQSE